MGLQMNLILLLSTVAYVAVGLAVGMRLVRLARRTGGFPERMLGIACLAGPGLLAPCFVVVNALPGPAWAVRAGAVAAQLSYALFCAVMVLFTWQCFRKEAAWARWACGAVIATGLAGAAIGIVRAFGVAEVGELKDMNDLGYRLLALASLAGHAWTGLESLLYYGRMRKRARLGLADPVVTNRFLLWGLVGACALVASGVPFVVGLLGGDSFNHVPTRLVGAAAIIFASVCLQLAFLPPPAYVAWLRAKAAAAAA
jgi:hypothetical protein